MNRAMIRIKRNTHTACSDYPESMIIMKVENFSSENNTYHGELPAVCWAGYLTDKIKIING